MKKQTDLLKLVSEAVLKAIETGALELQWNPDPESLKTWANCGYPNEIYVSQKVSDELVACDVRHELRHIVFGHQRIKCGGSYKRPCVEIPTEIEANSFLTVEQEEAYRQQAGMTLISARNGGTQQKFAGSCIPQDHLADFPPQVLHDALCKGGSGSGGDKGDESGKNGGSGTGTGSGSGTSEDSQSSGSHCGTSAHHQDAGAGEAEAAAFLLAKVLAQNGYEDADIAQAAGMAGGKTGSDKNWERFARVRPKWVDAALLALSPELALNRRRYMPRPVWSMLLLAKRWTASTRSRYGYKPKRAVMLIDTSGSIFGNRVLETIEPGVRALVDMGLKIRIICGDTQVTWDKEVEGYQPLQLNGGGGTVYDDLLARAMSYRPEEILFVTDLLPNYWPKKPDVPVRFIIPAGITFTPPWGSVLCTVSKEDFAESEKGGRV